MPQFTDPATGRPYDVGPDGSTRWLDQDPEPGPPWYRRPGILVAATGLGGLLIGGAVGGASSSAAPAAAPTATATTTATTTTTVTASALPPPPPVTTTVKATSKTTRTVTVTAKPRTVTVTKTTTAQSFAGGGGQGGGSGGGSVYYANCTAARAAGVTPLYVGDPGYRAGLDRDGDGVACE